ncbi:MAG TPA: DUF3566 domain-containing protein [Frankiaceae bacterium]|nr:DUF3566 domain-containing protein [Frankiaceae bacterium]
MSESQGSSGAAAADPPASAGRGGSDGDGRREDSAGLDERSQRLLHGGAASRTNTDTAARETVRSDSAGNPAAATTSAYAVTGSGTGGGTAAASQTAAASRGSQPRRARLRVSHINPLSVLRLSLLFGACMLVVLLVAVAALWFVLDSAGVFSSITEATSTITDNSGGGTTGWFSFGRVMLITAVLGVLNVVAFTLLSTVGALLYNLCSDFVGGVEVTLSER